MDGLCNGHTQKKTWQTPIFSHTFLISCFCCFVVSQSRGVMVSRCLGVQVVPFWVAVEATFHTVEKPEREIRDQREAPSCLLCWTFHLQNGSCNVLFIQFTINLLNWCVLISDLLSKSLFISRQFKKSTVVNGCDRQIVFIPLCHWYEQRYQFTLY